MGRKKHEAPEGAGEGWVISYCDMVSLLVTFFLMMLTFSTKDTGEVTDVGVGILKGKGGVMPKLRGLSMYSTLDGLSLRFNERCSFAPGSAEPEPELRTNLERLAAILARHQLLCVIEGF